MSVKEKKKRCRTKWLPVEWSGSRVGCTCARFIIGGVYFGGVGGEGALLHRHVGVGSAVQAAVTDGVQVAAICPKTRRRYRKRDPGRDASAPRRRERFITTWQKLSSPWGI